MSGVYSGGGEKWQFADLRASRPWEFCVYVAAAPPHTHTETSSAMYLRPDCPLSRYGPDVWVPLEYWVNIFYTIYYFGARP
jgi:hypothetical protein